MATKKTTTKSGTTVKSLEKEVSDLKKMIEAFSKASMPAQNMASVSTEREDVIFISLCPEVLNLTANINSNPIIYKFREFGEEQRIPYVDAKILVRQNNKFINQGAVYIDDEEFIKSERLTKYYKNILSQDEIMELFTADKETFTKQYNRMPKLQKEIFARMIGYKIHKGEDIDMNIVQAVNDSLNINILQNIKNGKGLITQDK